MSWFSGLGHDLSDAFSSVDKAANAINPFKGITDWGTKNTLAKIPVVGKPLGQLADWGNSHPAEVGTMIGLGFAGADAFGAGAAAGDAGAVGADAGMASTGLGAADAGGMAATGLGAAEEGGMAATSLGAADMGGMAATGLDAGAANADASFLPVTGAGGADGTAQLTPELAQQLGISPGGAADMSLGGGGTDSAAFNAGEMVGQDLGGVASPGVPDFGGVGMDPGVAASPDSGAALDSSGGLWGGAKDAASSVWDWAKAHPTQAAMLGFSFKNAMSGGQLPAGAKQANAASAAEVQQAQGVIQSGGQSSPLWANEKASIDSSIDANLKNAIEQAKQTAANNGMGGTNSAVVQQQINKLTSDANMQKQQLYAQALNSIVSQAVSMLSGGNATLTNIANMQMKSDQAAQAAAMQTAELALGLGSLKTTQPVSPLGGP